MTLQMQAGSSPAALRSGFRNAVAATEPDGLGDVARALERVATSAKTTALIDLARRSREKKIVFTHFRATQDELREALGTAGFDVAIVHGGLTASEKNRAIATFEARAEILLSSGIGGEGRNLQFCRTVINYDLPWNPMTIEQRVGRVHRIGQEHDVYVFNFCLAGSAAPRADAARGDGPDLSGTRRRPRGPLSRSRAVIAAGGARLPAPDVSADGQAAAPDRRHRRRVHLESN